MSKDRSRRYHDRVARQYDAIYDDAYWEFHDELTWRLIKPHLPRDLAAPCLDLGCGTGKWGLRLLKSGFTVTFVDNSGAMVEQVRRKLEEGAAGASRAKLLQADMVDMPAVPSDAFGLALAMGDPLSICSDAQRAAREIARVLRQDGIVIATADNKLAALDHYVERGNLDALEEFAATGRTRWLTRDQEERFELTMFTPAGLRRLFEKAGLDVISVTGKPVIPVRLNERLLSYPQAIERLIKMEAELSKDAGAAGRAAHLQIVARKRS